MEYDSTVETGYGTQEGLNIGYNPSKPGRASYHPQLCREKKSGLSVWSRLRPGDTVSSTDFTSFLDESWSAIPKRFKHKRKKGFSKVLSRMDSGYEADQILSWQEKRGIGYVVKMSMRGEIWSEVLGIAKAKYRKIETEAGEVEVCRFKFKRQSWSKERNVVVARWKEEADRAQTYLFDARGYTYSIFVTNLDWDEEDIYRFYDKRADVENHIREGKNDFCIDHISTDSFYANAADLELRLLAFNQMILFARNVLNLHSPRHFASTVRRRWLMIPAKLRRGGRQLVLKLSDWHPWQHKWNTYRENLVYT